MKKHFITGLVILLPLVIAIVTIIFLINLFTQPFVGMVSSVLKRFDIINQGFLFLSPEQLLRYGSQLIILIAIFLCIVALGMIARWLLVSSFLRLGDRILHRIPIFNTVYKTTQDIIKTLFVSDKNTFKQVVLVAFPHKSTYVIGLISREAPSVCSEVTGKNLISVLVPTTPNPTTGFLLMFPKEDLILIDMTPEDAVKYVLSCGVIIPPQHLKPAAF